MCRRQNVGGAVATKLTLMVASKNLLEGKSVTLAVWSPLTHHTIMLHHGGGVSSEPLFPTCCFSRSSWWCNTWVNGADTDRCQTDQCCTWAQSHPTTATHTTTKKLKAGIRVDWTKGKTAEGRKVWKAVQCYVSVISAFIHSSFVSYHHVDVSVCVEVEGP